MIEKDLHRLVVSLVEPAFAADLEMQELVEAVEKEYLLQLLAATHNNQCAAARRAGMHRNTFSRKLVERGIDIAKLRGWRKRPMPVRLYPTITEYRRMNATQGSA